MIIRSINKAFNTIVWGVQDSYIMSTNGNENLIYIYITIFPGKGIGKISWKYKKMIGFIYGRT